MLSNLAVSTHSGGISVAMEGREKSPSVANSGCYVLALFGVVLASPQYRTLLRFRRSFESEPSAVNNPFRPHFLRVPQETPMYHSTSNPCTSRLPCEELSGPRSGPSKVG